MKPVTKINITKIAQLAGVSKATVSRVLNDASCVTAETRDRVLEVIREYDYIPSAAARGLSTSISKEAAVIFPDLENPFFLAALKGITKVADRNGYQIMIFNSDERSEKEHDLLRELKGNKPAGLIMTPVNSNDEHTAQILKQYEKDGMPIILFDRSMEDHEFSMVCAEDEQGAYDAVCRLIEEGHTRIGYLAGDGRVSPIWGRTGGYRRALSEHGIPVREELMMQCDQKSETAYRKMKDLMEQDEPPTAIFSSNNMMTLGCLRYLTEHGKTIGRDIALIGFDDIAILNMLNYPISVVTRSDEHMGELAMEMLLRKIRNEEAVTEQETVPTQLILRGSEKYPH